MLQDRASIKPSNLFGEHKTARILTVGINWGQQRK